MLLPLLASLVLGQCPTLGTSVIVDDENGAPGFVLEGAAWEGPYRYPRAGLGASDRDRTYLSVPPQQLRAQGGHRAVDSATASSRAVPNRDPRSLHRQSQR